MLDGVIGLHKVYEHAPHTSFVLSSVLKDCFQVEYCILASNLWRCSKFIWVEVYFQPFFNCTFILMLINFLWYQWGVMPLQLLGLDRSLFFGNMYSIDRFHLLWFLSTMDHYCMKLNGIFWVPCQVVLKHFVVWHLNREIYAMQFCWLYY